MSDVLATRAEAVQLLRAAITRSGLSTRLYARTVLTRDERTVRRWLSGESPMPQAVVAFLTHTPDPEEPTDA